MSFTVENLEFYLLVLVRVSSLIMSAPVFSYRSIPMRVRAALSVFVSLVIIAAIPVVPLEYYGVLGYSVLVLKEMLLGVTLGLMCNMCFYIVSFSGQLMDMEMGLSMASMFNPMMNIQISITGNIYSYLLLITMVVTNMHYYVIRALVDSFNYFNVGKAIFPMLNLKNIVVDFMANYFVIAVRIILPVFIIPSKPNTDFSLFVSFHLYLRCPTPLFASQVKPSTD